MNESIVTVIHPPDTYYRNQVQDNRGQWRDVAPEFRNMQEAIGEAQRLSMSGSDVRVMKYSNKEEENN